MNKLLIALMGMALSASALAESARIVSLGGTVTEIIYDLGHGESVVATDISSLYPPEVAKLPRVGYYRAAPVEGIAALQPSLILASDQAGPLQTFQRLSDLGIPVVRVADGPSVDALYERIHTVAQALGDEAAGQALAAEVKEKLDASLATPATPLPTLFMMVRASKPTGAGEGTAVGEIMKLAGLKNVLGTQEGFRPLSAEGLIQMAPEMIVTTDLSVESIGGMDKFLAMPGVAGTPAARAGRVLVLDDLLILGLGPRLPEAVTRLKETAAQPARGS